MMEYGFSGVQQTDRFMEFVGSANRPLWRKSMENSQQVVSKQTDIKKDIGWVRLEWKNVWHCGQTVSQRFSIVQQARLP